MKTPRDDLGIPGNAAPRVHPCILRAMSFASLSRLAALTLLLGCVHPVRSTAMVPVPAGENPTPPTDLVRLELVAAEIPPRQRSGLAWDDDGTPPDAQLRVYRGEELLYESAVAADNLRPEWSGEISENPPLRRSARIRIELWDVDGTFDQPIGTWRGRGIPGTALVDAPWRILLEGRASLVLRRKLPVAHHGTGIPRFEERGDALYITDVIPFSPAGRAGLQGGDQIVGIEGRSVAELGLGRAVSLLSQAWREGYRLDILRGEARHEVTLDSDPIWLAR